MILKKSLVSLLSSLVIFGCAKKESPTEPIVNHPPVIERIVANPSEPFTREEVTLECRARDEDNDELSYDWRCDGGYFDNIDKRQVAWNTPSDTGEYHITARVEDPKGKSASRTSTLKVISKFDTVYVSEDSYIDSENPEFISQRDEFYSYMLWVYRPEGNESRSSYLRFEFNNIKGNIKSAVLLLDIVGWGSPIENPKCYLHEVTQNWTDYNLSYNNKPTVNPTPKYNFDLPWDANSDSVHFDITQLVKKWINSPSENKGFCLKPSSQMEGGYAFMSKEGIENWPWNKIPRIIIEKEH